MPDSTDNTTTSPAVLLGLDRPKPHNENAEIAVLGSMLIDPEAASSALSRLNFEGAFYRPAHQILFDAILALTPKGDAALDLFVLGNHLEKTNQLEAIGGLTYIQMLMDKVPTSANIEHYVQIVKENAVLRRIIATCSNSILKCYEADSDVGTLLDQIEQQIMDVSTMKETKDFQPIKPLVDEAMHYIVDLIAHKADVQGLPTGYEKLDAAMTGGLKPGMLFVLAARPSIGKTALALNMAANIALKGNADTPVGIFSLEMTAQQLTLRLIASEARVNINRWSSTSEQPQQNDMLEVKNACALLAQSHIFIDDTGGIDILELRAKARRMREQHHVQAIFIDYLQLVKGHTKANANRENEVAMISGSLKAMAKELNIPVVVLAQVSRAAEQGDGQPKLSHLRESGAIEQDADVVALLHRKREDQFEQRDDSDKGVDAELIIAKNRSGRTCRQMLTFFPQYTRFFARADEASPDDLPK